MLMLAILEPGNGGAVNGSGNWFDAAFTRLVRIIGVVIALHEEFFVKGDRSAGFGIAAMMISGSLVIDAWRKRDK